MPETRFRNALDDTLSGRSLPVMHYQPIVDLKRGVTVGYEALVRFPALPELSPDQWFASAHARGKRLALETMTTEIGLRGRDLLPPDTFLSVNVSPFFLQTDEFTAMLDDFGDLTRIVIEITEGDRVRDYVEFRRRLTQIRAKGGGIAVDDTGAGYASLKHVMEIRPQFVKLDRFFIADCQAEPAKSGMITMIGEAADRIDAWVVAEGIEQECELQELMRLAVPLGQGYLLGRPHPVMQSLDKDLASVIRDGSSVTAGVGLLPHLESAAIVDSVEEGDALVRSGRNHDKALVVDRWLRPLNLLEFHEILGVREIPSPMRVHVTSSVTEVLRRAMSRPIADRFDPIVAITEQGTFAGLLHVDRLMNAVLAEA